MSPVIQFSCQSCCTVCCVETTLSKFLQNSTYLALNECVKLANIFATECSCIVAIGLTVFCWKKKKVGMLLLCNAEHYSLSFSSCTINLLPCIFNYETPCIK